MLQLTIDTVKTEMIARSIPVNGCYEGLPGAALKGIHYSIEFGYDVWEKQTTLGVKVKELVKELTESYEAEPQYFAVTFGKPGAEAVTLQEKIRADQTIADLLSNLTDNRWEIAHITKIEAIPTPEA